MTIHFYPLPSRCTTVWTDQFVKSPCGTWEYAASPEGAFRLTMHYLDDNILGLGIKLQMLELVIQRLGSKLIFGQQPEIKVKLLVFPYGQIMIAMGPACVRALGSLGTGNRRYGRCSNIFTETKERSMKWERITPYIHSHPSLAPCPVPPMLLRSASPEP